MGGRVHTTLASVGLGLFVGVQKIFTADAGLTTEVAQGRGFYPGMIGHGQGSAGAVGILPDHRNMFPLTTLALGASTGNFGMAQITASATNASKAGSSDSNASRPNVSM